jgi:hypothetical protein
MSGGLELLGGAVRRSTRIRGFAPWRPWRETLLVLERARAVLEEYRQYLPLTLRQIFYRLVGANSFPKTEAPYKRLGGYLNRARRAWLIPMDAIRDDSALRYGGPGWASGRAFLNHLRSEAASFRLDRTQGPPATLMVLCKAAGMVPQLSRVTGPYDIPVISSGGFDNVTELNAVAAEIAAEGRYVEILHIGDHDPSGAHRYLCLVENIAAFVDELGGGVGFSQLAVIPEQIRKYSLPTAPPKAGDRRAFSGETCQAEALASDALARILPDAIQAWLDCPAYERALRPEAEEREGLVALISTGLPEGAG